MQILPQEASVMQNLTEFFGGAPTSMGVFYPTDFTILSFRSYSTAQDAAQALLQDGFAGERVRFISARELLEFLEDLRSSATGMVMSILSRLTDTQGANAMRGEERAKMGAGFVAVHCSTEADALHAQEVIRSWQPQTIEYYRSGGIESLVSPAVDSVPVAPPNA